MAKKSYDKALDLNQKGNELYAKGSYQEAKEYYEKAIKADPTFFYAYNNLGLVFQALREDEDAFKNFSKALEINPNFIDSILGIGTYYLNKSEYKQAEEYYLKTLAMDPNYYFGNYNLGLVMDGISEFDKAKKYYEKALQIRPNDNDAQNCLKKVKERLLESKGDGASIEDNTEESYINRMGRNLNRLALENRLQDCIGRENEIIAIFEVLGKRFKNNPVLIGQPGVGKTCIVEGIAKKIVEGKVPAFFKKKVIVEINTGMLIAGTKYRGEFELKIKKILEEAKQNPNMILFIDEIHTIIGAGRVEDSNLDIAQMLKPALQNGEITCIGATTIDEYKKYIEKDPALERRFYPVMIEEPSPEDTKKILYHIIINAREHYKVDFTKENVDEIVDLTVKYMKKRYLPDKAIDVLEKLGSRKMIRGEKNISSGDIRQMISEISRIEFVDDDPDGMKKLANLEELLKSEIIGQDESIDAVCNILRITKRRLDLRPIRPDGVFLLTGPTGVGKTYMAKCVCKHLFGNENKLIQVDMSEFSEPHSVSKLLGAAPGYVGFDSTNPITELVVNNPASILLLDEIEKADMNVIKLFLQVFEEGKITDSKGKKVYFSEVTVFMTSNILSKDKNADSNKPKKFEDTVKELTHFFPTEFLNRIDEILVFNYLSREDAKKILEKNILEDNKKRFEAEGIILNFENLDLVLSDVLQEGYSEDLGVRNLHKTFEKKVLSPIVKYIYEHNTKNTGLSIAYQDGKFNIKEK